MREAPFAKRISFRIRTPLVSRFTGFKSDFFNSLLAGESVPPGTFQLLNAAWYSTAFFSSFILGEPTK
jgi:hypothetical protein